MQSISQNLNGAADDNNDDNNLTPWNVPWKAPSLFYDALHGNRNDIWNVGMEKSSYMYVLQPLPSTLHQSQRHGDDTRDDAVGKFASITCL
jgi:hypothetical protein